MQQIMVVLSIMTSALTPIKEIPGYYRSTSLDDMDINKLLSRAVG